VLINTEARGKALARALGDAPALVLRQHGTVTVGRTAEEAVVHMICAEENARLQWKALQAGTPRYLAGEELVNLARENWTNAYEKYWHYHNETARRHGFYDGLSEVP
jgi:ribulose-5-phosphate 4-epimerase/fuculose-1-phosphate aldolase